MLVYDIPSRLKNLRNPSGQLRRFGFRANLSCWVIPTGNLPHNLIDNLRTAGVNVKIQPFDVGAGPALVAWALEEIRKEIQEQVKRTEKTLKKAEDKTTGALTDLENLSAERRDEAIAAYEVRAAQVCERLKELLDDVTAAGEAFGIDGTALSVQSARAAYDVYQAGFLAKAAAYAEATKKLREAAATSGDKTAAALANTAAQDLVPAGVLADALREAGQEGAANTLTDASQSEDGTFSLAGTGEDD
jgi:hypothetical protein